MKEELLEAIKKIIKDKGTHPEVATFSEIRKAITGDKALMNMYFRELVAEKKIKVRKGINQKLVEVL